MKQSLFSARFYLLIGALVFLFSDSYAQESYQFSASNRAQLWTSVSDSLPNGFAGGMNNSQIFTLDINGDGAQDLLVFDREGNRWMPFQRVNGLWKFRPQWAGHFPEVANWVLFADYTCDGLPDLFCSVVNGVGVYEASRVNGFLHFTWALPGAYLLSTYSSGSTPINLLVSSTDVPAILDVDGNGTVDILTFGQQASAVEFHSNA
ncbi:VCBS repeat-containing protein, partial [Schleiferiaceae bacterium]|nr:VCBS repeat-containing protein [Schleiferiaceae bacterium]